MKIIDFEISKMVKYTHMRNEMWTNTGSLHYKAPEMFLHNYNELIDMWAFGVIAYELAFGKLPFNS
jgi:serine/threonine protein kinase